MVKSDNIVRLLTLKESSNDAEALVSSMRNAGYAIRSSNIEDEEDLRQALDQQLWDLMIASVEIPDFNAKQALAVIQQSGKDIPVIVTSEKYDDRMALDLMKAGARDVVPESNSELLLLVIARELADHEERTAHRNTKTMFRESERRNRALMDSSRDAIAYIHEGMHIYSNSTYLDTFGFAGADELEGMTILDMISAKDHQQFKEILRRLGKDENPEEEFEFTAVREDGQEFSATMEFSPASIEGEPCTQVIIRTKADNKELEKELDTLRKQDLLTGLYNRNYFMEELEAAIVAATNPQAPKTSALLHLELDDYKKVSDSVGVAAADMLLSDFATILRENTPGDYSAFRFAGSVFTILAPEQDINNVAQVARKICAAVEQHIFDIEGQSITSTCSTGISQISETTADAKKALANADMACKKARADGGNQLHLHSAEDEKASTERDQRQIKLLQNALENDRFRLVYQPIVSLHAEPGERYEVLLRMLDENGKEIMPGEFLDVAETSGLMRDIDRWVTKQAVKVLATKRNTKVQTQLFIKLSFDSLKDQTFLVWVSKLLKAARLHGSCLVFEIGEHAAITALKETKLFVNGLNQLHCQFAIDHLGSETDSFAYLKHLDAKYLKIDGSFIKDLAESEQHQEAVKNLAELARNQSKMTIAEHVQEANSLAMLWQYGVNFIQGYYLQHPDGAMTYDFTGES